MSFGVEEEDECETSEDDGACVFDAEDAAEASNEGTQCDRVDRYNHDQDISSSVELHI